MAVVWRATHTETERPVALKLVRGSLALNEQARELFVREAKIAARIGRSDHIVDVLDAGIDDALAVPFLAMELLVGEPLDVRLHREGPIPHGVARELFEQLADALDQAHAAGVVHRDLKPQNLFLARGRKGGITLKVLDFGIAKLAEQAQQSSTQIGTPAYAAPEQLGPSWRAIGEGRGRKVAATVSPQTDVWALGLVVFEALTGSRSGDLWAATTLAELPLKVVLEPTPIASERAGDRAALLPPGFDAWLARCLEVDATLRFPSAGAAIGALVPSLGAATPGLEPVLPMGSQATIPQETLPSANAAAPSPSPDASPYVTVAAAPLGTTSTPGGTGGGGVAAPIAAVAAALATPVASWHGTPQAGWAGGGTPQGGAWPAQPPPWNPSASRPVTPFGQSTGSSWAPPPPGHPAGPPPLDPQLAAFAQARRLEPRHADLAGLRTLEPWMFLPPIVASARELRGPLQGGTIALVEVVRGDAIGRATGEDRSVLAIVQAPQLRSRVALRSRQAAGFADNVARGWKLLDSLVSDTSHAGATSINDPLFESHFELRCPTPQEGHVALTPALRSYLVHQRFRGTLELRAGLFAMSHFDVTRFEARALDYMLGAATAILQAAAG
jgi:serine/threonine protein kinase